MGCSGSPARPAAGPTTTASSPRARPTKRRSGPSSGGSATPSSPASKPTPGGPQEPGSRAREGNRERLCRQRGLAHTPHTGSSVSHPEPGTTLRPATQRKSTVAPKRVSKNARNNPLDNKEASICMHCGQRTGSNAAGQTRVICVRPRGGRQGWPTPDSASSRDGCAAHMPGSRAGRVAPRFRSRPGGGCGPFLRCDSRRPRHWPRARQATRARSRRDMITGVPATGRMRQGRP